LILWRLGVAPVNPGPKGRFNGKLNGMPAK
jgi:hypothetical protein